MKRVFVLVLVLMLCAGALADTSIDWANISNEEIYAIIEAGQAELKNRAIAPENSYIIESGTVLVDTGDITITVSSEPRMFAASVLFDIVIENHSEYSIWCDFKEVEVDGWEEHGVFGGSVKAGLKSRETCLIDLSGPQAKSIEEIKDCFLNFKVYADDNGSIYDSGQVEFVFNK